MSRWLSACAAAVLLSASALAQTDKPSATQPDQTKPTAGQAAGSTSTAPSGTASDRAKSGDARQTTGSGAGGSTRSSDVGTSSNDAYKKDFEKK